MVTAWLGCSAGLVACQDPFRGAARAVVGDEASDAEQAAIAAAPAAGDARLVLDASRSRVAFVGAKVTATQTGHFERIEGQAWVTAGEVVGLDVTVHVDSLTTALPRLTEHLRADDFLASARWPQAHLWARTVGRCAREGCTHVVRGVLELRGHRRWVDVPVTIERASEAWRGRTRVLLDRQAFGVAYRGAADDLIRDDVLLELDLRFTPAP